jgi:hypothetical protein
MLYTSTKNIAYEVISCLIQVENNIKTDKGKQIQHKGVLTDIIKWLTSTKQYQMLNEVEISILD